MKRWLTEALRRWHLLAAADRINFSIHRACAWWPNRSFRQRHPDYRVPPPELAFEAYGHTSWDEYTATGRQHAQMIAAIIVAQCAINPPRVLEWGCGAGRILRALRETLPPAAQLTGVDIDAGAIAWCVRNLPGIRFQTSDVRPSLAFNAGEFDVVYNYSVLTHLAPSTVEAWIPELARVLTAQGVLIATTHGEHYQYLLRVDERESFQSGRPVVKANYREGRKYFLSFHPAAYMRHLLKQHFERVQHLPGTSGGVPQDVWMARGPRPLASPP